MQDNVFLIGLMIVALLAAVYISTTIKNTENTLSDNTDIKALVKETIRQYDEAVDKKEFFVYLNSNEAIKGDQYVFVIQYSTGKIIVQPIRNDLINSDVRERIDVEGKKYGEEFLTSANTEGVFVEYKHIPPGAIEPVSKISFVQLHKNYLFGSGKYIR